MFYSVLIADDHFSVRYGIQMMLKELLGNNTEVDFASRGEEIIQHISQKKYDILICDINMPETNALDVVKKTLVINPALKILILSVNSKETYGPIFYKSGIYGYICKGESDQKMKQAIKRIQLGKKDTVFMEEGGLAWKQAIDTNPIMQLSERERSVLELLLAGKNITEISHIMELSISSVSTYKNRIYNKFRVHSLIDLFDCVRYFKEMIYDGMAK